MNSTLILHHHQTESLFFYICLRLCWIHCFILALPLSTRL
ncbi:hypothetical protein CIPAW_07G127100 [Carya illinoinensis]|uniref:Uncharacterized protein n=1 Tax=Carya illinoinensis TaxID=32201 RepID=A0A8T1PUC7_CARIL|nr:hypothetical protein CIPAW_07G127100 [Carya illinoinensis]